MMPSRRLVTRLLLGAGLPLCLLALACTRPVFARNPAPTAWPVLPERPALATLTVYDDALGTGWQDWSWGGLDRDFANASPHHGASGTSISVNFTSGYSGLQIGNSNAVDGTGYDTLSFWINGGSSGGQQIIVQLTDQDNVFITADANTWKHIQVPLSQFSNPGSVDTLRWYNGTAGALSVFYLDDITLQNTGLPTPTIPPPSGGPALTVNAGTGLHAISPDIYGLNFADATLAADIDLPVNRWGGNATTRYNWQLDISNHAGDWFFENIDNDNAHPENLPNGSSSDQFVDQNRATGTDTLLTLPLIGYTPKGPRAAKPRNCGFPTNLFPSQQAVAPDAPCGNGKEQNGTLITGNDPLNSSIAISPTFVAGWITHLVGKYGAANAGGVRFYNLDNETGLWNSTQRDVHPQPVSYDELISRTLAYAPAIKAADPGAKLLGPVAWGWLEYYYSALDLADGNGTLHDPLDRIAHGNVPFVEWYLQQLHAYDQAHSLRLLDYLDLHMYPQASGVALSGAGSTATQQLRLRSTRSLWDPTYVDESWINAPINLIPNMRTWVANDYPGTKLALTEYNWGALDNINGAVAQADILGIFGREGLDLATLWDPPTPTQPGAYAFRMYRNYDGQHHGFGETEVQSMSADQESLSVYAARRGDGALTIMVVNKHLTQTYTSSLALSGFSAAAQAAVYRYSAADLNHIQHLADQDILTAGFTADYPPQSITLFVLQPGVPLSARAFLPLTGAQ